jgi:dephospho-CoA kinase
MIKVGLTGNYYSGQYEIAKLLEEKNVKVFDADLQLKYHLNYSSQFVKEIKSVFGSDVYHLGLLDLNKFENNHHFNKLIDIVEFDIVKQYELFRLKHKNSFFTIFKYSYLFERKMNESMDYTICAYRPKFLRRDDMSRLTYFSGFAIDKIVNNEMDDEFKCKKSDFVIENYNKDTNKYYSDIVIGLENKIDRVIKVIENKKPQEDFLGV